MEVSVGTQIKNYAIDKSITIGRGSSADIVIVADGVSRNHLLIELEKGKVFLTDLGSSNGTLIGDEPLPAKKKTEYNEFYLPITIGKETTITLQYA